MNARHLLLTILCLPATAFAQPRYSEYGSSGPAYQPVPPWPVEMGFSQHHSSTAAEGYLRGSLFKLLLQALFIGMFSLLKDLIGGDVSAVLNDSSFFSLLDPDWIG